MRNTGHKRQKRHSKREESMTGQTRPNHASPGGGYGCGPVHTITATQTSEEGQAAGRVRDGGRTPAHAQLVACPGEERREDADGQ